MVDLKKEFCFESCYRLKRKIRKDPYTTFGEVSANYIIRNLRMQLSPELFMNLSMRISDYTTNALKKLPTFFLKRDYFFKPVLMALKILNFHCMKKSYFIY